MFRDLAYCPLDLPKVVIDDSLINLLVDHYNPGHHDGIWDTLPLLGRVKEQKDFFNSKKFEEAWERRYDHHGEILINQAVYDNLRPLFEQFKKLPIEVTHAQILRANKDVPKHHDMKHRGGLFLDDFPSVKYEPNGWKIILNETDKKSFFVSKNWHSDNTFISLPKDTNTFVINEKKYPHGSSYVQDKCVVSIFGIVKEKESNELISKSLKKYKDYAISFSSS